MFLVAMVFFPMKNTHSSAFPEFVTFLDSFFDFYFFKYHIWTITNIKKKKKEPDRSIHFQIHRFNYIPIEINKKCIFF